MSPIPKTVPGPVARCWPILLLLPSLFATAAERPPIVSTRAASLASRTLRFRVSELPTNRIARDQILLPRAVIGTHPISVLRGRSGTWIRTNIDAREASDHAAVELLPGEQVILAEQESATGRTSPASVQRLGPGGATMPGVMLWRKPSGEVVQCELFLRPRRVPLPWDGTAQSFRGELVVGVDRSDGSSGALDTPTVVQLFASHAELDPGQVAISAAGTAGYQTVRVSCTRTEKDIQIDARSDFAPAGESYVLATEPLGLGTVIQQVLPAPVLMASILGGLAGGLLRLFRLRRWSAAKVATTLAQSLLSGLIAVCVVAAGLTFGAIQTGVAAGAAGGFALAALSGYSGTKLLDDWLARMPGRRAHGGKEGTESGGTG